MKSYNIIKNSSLDTSQVLFTLKPRLPILIKCNSIQNLTSNLPHLKISIHSSKLKAN